MPKTLRDQDWLDIAKRLYIGQKVRVLHAGEHRPNLVIGHDPDKYWAYCHRCGIGAVRHKEHVLLQSSKPSKESSNRAFPGDAEPVLHSVHAGLCEMFLQQKGLSLCMLPKATLISPSERRLLVPSPCMRIWMGRDLTGKSAVKWCRYNLEDKARFFWDSSEPHGMAVVLEDMLSFYKVRYALQSWKEHQEIAQGVSLLCTLGCHATDDAVLSVVQHCSAVAVFYDADAAGDAGYEKLRKRHRLFMPVLRIRPPDGLDPKDMRIDGIRELIRSTLQLAYSPM